MPTLRIRGVALILFFLLQPPGTYTVEEAKPLLATWSPSKKQFLNSATSLKVISRCSADAAKQQLKMIRSVAPIVGPYGMRPARRKGQQQLRKLETDPRKLLQLARKPVSAWT